MSGNMNLTLKVWRQKNTSASGTFETYQASGISPDMSFLEMMDVVNEDLIKQGKDPFKDFEKFFAASDLSVANLECVVSGNKGKPEEKPFAFRAHPRVLPILKKHFSAVSLANNHSYDYGEKTFLETLRLLEQAGRIK